MNKVKTLVSIGATLVLLFSVAVPVAYGQGGPDDDVSGSFTTANVAPKVGDITISPTSMTPQQEWTVITVPVKDKNTLADINEVHVEVFYDSAGNNPGAPGSADVQTCAILTWKRGASPEWTIAPGSTTWAIDISGCSKSDDGLGSGHWVFSFKVGKVATESPGGADWDIYAKATDADSATGDKYLRDIEMNWYGEITASTSDVTWTDVEPGTGFADDVNEQGGIKVNYIANGKYDEQVKSSDTWTGVSYKAKFDATGDCKKANEFSLMANDTDYFKNAEQVNTTGVTIDNGSQTDESGNDEKDNTLWLKLADVFAHDTYEGTITYIIAND